MKIIEEIMPKVKAEVRLDKDNKTLWIKTDTLDGYGRVIIEDGSNWCRVFYEDKDENSSEKPNSCEMPCEECGHWEHGAGDHYYCALLEMGQECYFESKNESTLMFANEPKTEPMTDCTEALTLLWIKNMVTDEEFYRIDARLKCIPQTERSE